MGQKYMILNGGKKELKASLDSSSGAADAGEIPSLGSDGKLDPSFLQDIDVTSIVSFEDLASGDYVNIFDDSGTVKVRKADNSNDRPAHGYVKDTVVAPAASGPYTIYV